MNYKPQTFTTKTGLQVTLRSPQKEDAKELLDLIISLTGQTPFLLSTPEDFAQATVEGEAGFIESYLNSESFFVVAQIDGKLIGDCNVDVYRHKRDNHRCIVGIAIDEKYWDKGIGSIMFDEMIKFAKDKGLEQMELDVNSTNPRAIHLYEKKGFKIVGTIPHALKCEDGTYYDEHKMIKQL